MRFEATPNFQNIKKFINTHSVVFVFILYILFTQLFHISCLVKSIIGIPCPGCGLTRATLAFLRFDFKAAFSYHPLFWLATPFLILALYGKKPLFNSKKIEITIYIVVGLLFIGVYIYRMLTVFPNTEPMTLNNNSALFTIIKIIKYLLPA